MLHQISFGVAPSICAFAAGMRTGLDQLFLTCFVLAGLARLARFNVTILGVEGLDPGKHTIWHLHDGYTA
jgi:phosphatidylserine synthase